MNPDESTTHPGIYPWLSGHWSFFVRRLRSGRLAHALMIEGPEDSGKTALAQAMIGTLLCTQGQDRACGQCRSCQLRKGGAHPDYFDIHPVDSEVIKVEQVRGLISSLELTTSVSARKVAYLHPAETMNSASANALLKSLEEPAGDTVLILVCHHPGGLPITIRSRCQLISVSQPDTQLVHEWLMRASGKPADQVRDALQAAGGSPLRAEHYLDSTQLDAYAQVRDSLATLLRRPGAVSMISNKLDDLDQVDLWRWLSACTGDVIKSSMADLPLNWLPDNIQLQDKKLLDLQRQADINRQLSATTIRKDLLLQDWLIKWSEQIL